MSQLYGHWCSLLLRSERVRVKEKSMNTYQRVRRSQEIFWLYEWELMCVRALGGGGGAVLKCVCVSLCGDPCVCRHVSVPAAVARVGQKRLFLHIFKQQHSSVQQDPADGGNARGCQGGGEESHCFKETRHNCGAEHLIQARASTLQPSMARRRCSRYGWFGRGWLLYSLLLHFLVGANKRDMKRLQLQPVMQLRHPAPSPSVSPPGRGEPENGQTATEQTQEEMFSLKLW